MKSAKNGNTTLDLDAIRALILDMDGVLWRADQPIGDLHRIFAEISRGGRKVALATNNSTRSVDQYLEKLAQFGVSLEAWQIINSSEATAQYLRQRFPSGGPVFIIGEIGLVDALKKWGFYPSEKDAQAVVMGMDRKLTYEKLCQAVLLVRAGAHFVGTNADRTFPTPEGLVPGAGAILAAVEMATDVKPYVVGKPAVEMYRVALDRLGTVPGETLVVGDRLETDISGAQVMGCLTGLVLSGVTTEEQARAWTPPPDLIEKDLASLVALLNNGS